MGEASPSQLQADDLAYLRHYNLHKQEWASHKGMVEYGLQIYPTYPVY